MLSNDINCICFTMWFLLILALQFLFMILQCLLSTYGKKSSQHLELYFQDDSLEKLNKLLDACRGLGVETNPMIIDGLGIIPLFSWYHEVIGLLVFIIHPFAVFSYSIIHDLFHRVLNYAFMYGHTLLYCRALIERRI